MTGHDRIEIAVRGEWLTVPALYIGGKSIIVTGKWLRVAVIYDEEWLDSELNDPDYCIQVLKRCDVGGVRPDVFTFAQKLPETAPRHPFPMEWDSIAAIPLTGFENWWERKLPQETRKNVRRAAKRGVDVTVRTLDADLVEAIVDLNNDSPIRQGLPFSHYGKNRDQVRKDQSSFLDRSDFICAYVGRELIGFLKLVYGQNVASVLQLITKSSQYDRRPANALIAKAVEHCHHKGLSYLVYGKHRYGNQPKTSLMEFKTRNGFEEILTPRFYVPLTIKGGLGMSLGLHRDRVGILPRRVISIGRRVRTTWYSLVSFPSRCSSRAEQPNCNWPMERSTPPAGSNLHQRLENSKTAPEG